MAVTNNFSASTLDLNGVVGLSQPTSLVWGPDGRLYVTEVDGDVKVLTIEFGDPDPNDADQTAQFYVTDAVTVPDVKNIPNFNDNGTSAPQNQRQVTGIDVTNQYNDTGDLVLIDGKPAVTMYVTSSDSRIGAGGSGNDAGLDTNSGVITKLTQTGPDSWDAVDIVRGLARSEENHAVNGLEVIQTLDGDGKLIEERLIVSNGGNANTGAPSNNFAGQQEQPYSGALLEVDLDALKAIGETIDPVTGRTYIYDLPTLDDPTRPGTDDNNDPFGGNDGLNSAKLTADSPVQIYSTGYRNAYDVEVTDDGRVFTYDNGANNNWGGRPVGEPNFLDNLFVALNLNNGDGNANDEINDAAFNPSNNDSLHEATRSDDLEGRELSAGKGGAQTYEWEHNGETLTLVYGGHPNPTRAEGSRAGLLFSPEDGTDNAFLMVSNEDSFGNGGGSDYDEVIAWLTEVENNDTDYPDVFNTQGQRIYGADTGDLTKKIIAMTPGVSYDIYVMPDGSAEIRPEGTTTGLPAGGQLIGTAGLPSDIAEIVSAPNPIEGNYLEAGSEDGSLDFGKGSVNGLTEYTSTILDDGDTKMSGALLATSLNQGQIYVIGRDEDGVVQTNDSGQFTQAADRTTLQAGGGPLGIATLGDDVGQDGLNFAFTGSIWVATFNQNGPLIEVFQPEGVGLPLAGADIVDEEDNDLDGVKDIEDPFEYSPENGYQLSAGETLEIDFNPQNTNFPISLSGTGLLGAALDGVTANQDARTAEEGISGDQLQDGLFDNGGNILPGGNAPILKIKTVVDGSVVGTANTARDVMQTGFRPDPDVDRIAITMSTANWIPGRTELPQTGQLSGMMFSDGTQSNFLRVVYGGVDGGVGIEVGVELGDANYTKLATVLLPGLSNENNDILDLRLIIDQDNGFSVEVGYRFGTDGAFTSIPLNGGTGFSLPTGVLQDVLTGDHTIQSAGGPALTSGAAVGFLAEDVPGGDLIDVDFFGLKIESLTNELAAGDAASVGQTGTAEIDTIVYDGSETDLAALDGAVENFDGTQSVADYTVTGNAGDNVIKVGTGANTITTGDGADSVRGTKAELDGDTITDFTQDDEVIINGVSVTDINVTYEQGATTDTAVVVIDGDTRLTFTGEEFEDFVAADGDKTFEFEYTAGGVRLVTKAPLTPVVAINAGGDNVAGVVLREQTVDFVSDGPTAPKTGFAILGDYKAYSSPASNAFDYPGTELDDILKNERSSPSEANWGYAIDVPDGDYLVDLIFAEIFHGVTNGNPDVAGKREFDVFIEGQQVEDNFDIIDDAGAAGTQVIKTYQVTVTDGVLEIELNMEVDQAKLSGLVVWAVGGGFVPPADETAPEIAGIFVENPQSDQDSPRDVVVTLTDNAGFEVSDFAALDGSELVFTGIIPASVGAPTVEISANGTTATLTYELLPPAGAWPTGQGQITIAAGAYSDTAGNSTAATDSAFFVEPNLSNLVAGDVALAINVGETTNTVDASLEGTDKNTYGGAITGDTIIGGINLQADDAAYYTPTTKTGSNIDGKFGPTGSNTDLDGSALHTYRDAASGSFTATYPIANGIYVVELWFAELFHDAAGNRQGDYTINGEEFALNFDAFTAAGAADTAVKITKNVIVTNGEIVIDVNADTGQPGFNAIVVYDAIPSDLPPTVSVADVTAVEGEDATVTFSRIGDLSEDVTVEFTLTPGTAEVGDFGAPSALSVTILAGESTASFTVPIVDDEDDEPAESFSVAITNVANTSADAVISGTNGSATVTIEASDPTTDLPTGGTILALDFETAGDPLVEGGFDTALGGPTALEAGKISVVDGKLVVNTSQGDLSNVPTDASKNDLVVTTDLSDPTVNNIIISTAFDNPFTAAYLASIGAAGDVISNYKQQGIIIATGDAATNQNADQFMKLVYGGGSGTQTQLWSQDTVDQPVKLADVSAAAPAAFSNADIARIELALVIDKAAATVAQFVTYYDENGSILGGVRPDAVPGFATAPAQPIPAALLTAIVNGTSVVGVTSTDFGGPVDAADSFPATWDYLNVTSPQVVDPEGPDAVNGVLYVDFSDDGLNPTDVGALANGSNTVVAEQVGDDDGALGRDRDYFTFEVPEGQVLAAINLTGYSNQELTDTAGFIAIQQGAQVTTNPATGENSADLLGGLIYSSGEINNDILTLLAAGGDVQGTNFPGFDLPLEAGTYTIWLNQGADLPTTVTFDFVLVDRPADVTLSIADAAQVVENGDFGVTVLAFEVTASDSFDGTLTVTYDTAMDAGLTQDVTFAGGVGSLTVLVDNDDVANGTDDVSVTLVSAVDALGADTVAISDGAATADGAVTEDEGTGAATKGAAVFALNVNGGEQTVDGVTYQADNIAADPVNGIVGSNAAWTGFNLYTDGEGGGARPALADGDYDRDGTGFTPNDLLYVNDRWGGATGSAPLTYTRDGFAPGEYIMTLKLAELFDTNFVDDTRVFSLTVNGQEVVTNLDLFDVPGLEVDQAYDVDVPVTIGADGILNLSFTASADNAKVNAFALYEAVSTVAPTDLAVSVADVTVEEDSGAALVTFTRDGDTASDVTITFALTDGTGVAGVDYDVPTQTTVTILAGETTATVSISLIDNGDEAAEIKDFTVSITDVATAGGESASLGKGTATVTIDDDEAFDPADIDGDGIINTADPFAYDGENGGANVLAVGGVIRQDFDVDTADVFSAEGGFTGIITNTDGFVPGGASATDPYGDRTTEATSVIENGVLKITSSEEDLFADNGTGNTNTIRDNYVSAVDVSGVNEFSIKAKAANPFDSLTGGNFKSFGIIMGAGGTDDYLKLVVGAGGSGTRGQLAQENSTDSGKETNVNVTALATNVLFQLDINKSSAALGFEGLPTVIGTITLLGATDDVLQTIVVGPQIISGSLLETINGNNPLTGGTGGLAYGVSITDIDFAGNPDLNRFTGEWDYLEISAPDFAPEVDAGIAAQAATENTELDFTLPLDVFKDDNGVANLTLTASLEDDSALPAWLTFDPATGRFTGTPADGDDAVLSVKVTADDGANPPVSTTFELTVTDVPGPFIWYADADGDGVGTSADQVTDYVAPGAPGDYVLSDLGDDADDTDATIYPDAPEINDGKDNDQDGSVDEDNQAPVAGEDGGAVAQGGSFTITRTELLSNDSDPDGDSLTLVSVLNEVNGAVAYDAATGVISFTPEANFIGIASFDYVVRDDYEGTTVSTVVIDVTDGTIGLETPLAMTQAAVSSYSGQDRPADASVVVDEAEQTITVSGNAWKKVALPDAALITDASELWFKVTSPAIPELLGIGLDTNSSYTNGTQELPEALFQIGGLKGTLGQANQEYRTYTNAGEEVFYKISLAQFAGQSYDHLVFFNDQDAAPMMEVDGVVTYSASSMFSEIRIVEPATPNAAPVAAEDAQIMESDAQLAIAVGDLLANDNDPDGDDISVTAVGNPANGTVELLNGLITFTAANGYSGPASFEYTIADATGATSTTTVNITVLEPGGGDVIKEINFAENSIESYDRQDSKPGTGFEVSQTGDSLTLDGNVWKKTALTGGDYTITENTVLRFNLTVLTDTGEIIAIGLENDNAFRTEDDALFQLFGSQNFATWSNQDYNGQYGTVGQPTAYEISLADYVGQSFDMLAFVNDDDVNGTSVIRFDSVQLVEELITAPGDTAAPEIFGGVIADQIVSEDTPFEIELPFFDTDTPLEDLVFSFTNLPGFVTEEDGLLMGQPANADVGDYTIAVTATDPEGNATTGTFTLTVENVNDAPELVGVYDDVELIVNNEIILALPEGLFVDADAGTVLTYSAEGLPAGVVIDPVTGALSGTPTESGDFTVTIIASDGPADDPDTLSASATFTMDIASGPPREAVLIEAEDFTAFSDPSEAFEGFFKSFAGAASGREVIRVKVNGEGFISTDLDAAGVVPGFYNLSIIHFDESDGAASVTIKLDLGDGSEPGEIGSFVMDRDEPGQGNGTQAGNIFEAVFETVNIPAGAKLIIEGQAESGEVLRIDAVRFDPIDNTPPVISTAAEITVEEGTSVVVDVDATDLEGADVSYAIVGGADAALFGIDPVTGEVSFLSAPDFETPLDADGDNVYDVVIEASDGDVAAEQSLVITVANLEEAPEFSSATAVDAVENDTAAATVAAVDPDGAAITYALAGTGADEALFAVDPVSGVVTFLAAPDFETAADTDADGVYEVSVTADDGTSTTTTDLQVTVTDANDAPVAVVDPTPQPVIIDAPLSLSIVGLFTDQDATDTITYTIISGAPAGVTGIVDGALVGTPTEIGAFDVVIQASDGIAPPVQTTLTLNVDAADNTYGRVAPSQDLDEDGTINSADLDVDGDDIANVDDSFAYDAENGTLIADGESIALTFDVNGTPYQNGFTGLLQAGTVGTSDLADFNEDTGATTVADGLLTTVVGTGDTGGNNTPEDDFQLGVKNADFTVEARVINPFETKAAVSFDQIGIHIGVDSTDFVKLVFGNAVEFSARIDDAETKATGGNQVLPNGLTPADFGAVDITLTVNSISATAATVTAVATFLDGAGNPIAGAAGISFGSLAVTGAMAAALADEGFGVGAGFTHAHAPTSTPFNAQLDSFTVTATDGGSVDPSNALAVFEGEGDLFTGNSYGANEVGSAVLEVMTGNNNIQSSNFGQNSFELTNTGDKQIAAVFIDVSTALYQDSVFDPDGAGGDDAVKPWGINSGGAQTGASISGGVGGYFLAGVDPLANDTGTGQASNGGYKGAIIKFNDFQSGEQVGFSGDMDPNSIAGLDKGSTFGVDNNSTDGWDVGGISGHEIIGSTFTILFDDGTTATGQLASDGSSAGSQGLATESGFASDAPTLTVNGFGAGDVGTYGVTQPTILVTGDPGSTVRITMTKGFDPVGNTNAGIDQLVEDRLDRYDFKVSNSFDNQTVDVVIGDDGTFDATGFFDYDDSLRNNVADGTFPGDDVADIGFVASVVDPSQGNLPVSPVTKPIYLTNEGGPVEGDPIANDGGNALEVFAGEADLITSATYADGDVGAATLGIMVGSNDIEDSNFGANSFQVTNTGDKKISAVFIDVSDALYQDSVFDPDGAGGDSVAKPWAVNSAGGTGAYVNGGTGGLFLPGVNPLANTTGTGIASDGGYKGAIIKFTDFNNGETVGFSGDMDPNSIAGLTKGSVDTAATDSWDVGGVSGHELIGSRFTVLFDDGTTASGQLASDGSASGSQALASQDGAPATTPTLTVNGVAAGGLGTYGGTQPTIIVTGDEGDTVRITLTKGFNPVENAANGIAQLVEDRLDRYDFKASNNFDSQSVDVVIGADGTFDATGLFDYDDSPANSKEDGTFAGDDVAQIGFVASVIDPANNDLPISAVTAPIYLTNDGGPVPGDPVLPTDGFFEIIGSGNSARFKIQIEDANGSGGTNPGSSWTYATAPDVDGNQAGFQGDGYYIWKEGATEGTNPAQGILDYEIFIPEGEEGVYSFRARSSRDNDPNIADDQANDVWLRIDADAEALQVNDTNSVSNAGFVKVFGVGTGGWGNSGAIDSVSEEEANFAAQFELTAGFHTISIAGRSGGYAVDFFDLYKGGAPSVNASNSTFTTENPGPVSNDGVSVISASSDDWEEFGGAGSSDLEFGLNGGALQSVGMRFTGIDVPDGQVISEAYFQFEANGSSSGAASFTIEVEASEAAATYSTGSTPDDRTYLTEDFDWNDVEEWTDGNTYRTPDIADLIEAAIGTDGVLDGELGFRITGSGARAAHAFDSDGGAPELIIMFEDDLII